MRPVVVWKRAFVATPVSQRLLKNPCEVAVPCEEVACAVDGERLLDMRDDEIVVTASCARCNRSGCLCGELMQTVYRICEGDSLLGG